MHYALDLKAFFRLLLKKSLLLLSFVVIGGGVGFGIASLQTPKWKATAQLEAPKLPALGNYFELFNLYTFLSGGEQTSYKLIKDDKNNFSLTPEVSKQVETLAVEESYAEFKRNLISPDVLIQFLIGQEKVKQQATTQNQPLFVVAQSMLPQFVFQHASRSVPSDRLSVISDNPDEAARLLNEFIAFASQTTRQTLNAELIAKWKTLFNLVNNAVQANLGVTQQGANFSAQDWRGKLKIMQSVKPLDDQLVPFRFAKSPSVPIHPDSPNKMFYLMIGAISGLLLALATLSFSSLLRRK